MVPVTTQPLAGNGRTKAENSAYSSHARRTQSRDTVLRNAGAAWEGRRRKAAERVTARNGSLPADPAEREAAIDAEIRAQMKLVQAKAVTARRRATQATKAASEAESAVEPDEPPVPARPRPRTDLRALGAAIRAELHADGATQQDLARYLGLPPNKVSRALQGRGASAPEIIAAMALAVGLATPAGERPAGSAASGGAR